MEYHPGDRKKLERLVTLRKEDLFRALRTFAIERRIPQLLPVETLILRPTLVFRADGGVVPPNPGVLSYLKIVSDTVGFFEGNLKDAPA